MFPSFFYQQFDKFWHWIHKILTQLFDFSSRNLTFLEAKIIFLFVVQSSFLSIFLSIAHDFGMLLGAGGEFPSKPKHKTLFLEKYFYFSNFDVEAE